jgi:glutamate racemase
MVLQQSSDLMPIASFSAIVPVRSAEAPIGIFDSGLGGLSVVQEVRTLLPDEDLIYYADSAHCPYGTRTPEEISERCRLITAELVDQGVKAIILACNTACAVALPELRARFDLPIIGLEPAVKPATRLTRTQRVGVLATPRTVASERLANLVEVHAHDIEVRLVAAPGLVELVEAGMLSGHDVERILRPFLDPLITWGVDVVVLGCTHYPFLRDEIQRLVGPDVHVVDSGEAIARRTRVVLETHDLRTSSPAIDGSLSVMTSGDAVIVAALSRRLLGYEVETSTVIV